MTRPAPTILVAGYLGQLAARLQADEGLLQRRRPALFEPVLNAPVDTPAAFAETVETSHEDARARAPIRRQEPRRRVPDAAPAPAQPLQATPEAPPRPRLALPPSRSGALAGATTPMLDVPPPAVTSALRPGLPASVQPPPVDPTVREARPAAQPISVATSTPPAASVARAPQPAAAPLPQRPPWSPATAAARPAPVSRGEREPATRSEGERAITRRADRPPPAIPPLPVTRVAPAPPARPLPAHRGAAAAPVRATAAARPRAELSPVQVTIGRVEVRAVSAPSPAKRDAPAAGPRLTLEDYLRQRGGGVR